MSMLAPARVSLRARIWTVVAALAAVFASAAWVTTRITSGPSIEPRFDDVIGDHAAKMLEDGRQTFRFDTFGDEAFWGDALHLHRAIAGSPNGGIGPGVSPKTDRKSTRLNSSHGYISYAVFCLKKKKEMKIA